MLEVSALPGRQTKPDLIPNIDCFAPPLRCIFAAINERKALRYRANWTYKSRPTNLVRQTSLATRNITASVPTAPPLRDAAHRYAAGQGSLRSPCQDFWRFCLTDSYFCF